jgi:hypothetical protein
VQHPTDTMLSAAPGGTCAGCHRPGSVAERGTGAIVSSFCGLQGSLSTADSLLKVAEVRGMETAPGRANLKAAQDALVGVRAGLHSFDPKQIGAVLIEGATASRKAADYGREALRDWRNRRVGMVLSLVVILILIGLVVAKIRQMES